MTPPKPNFKMPPEIYHRIAALESDLRALTTEWRNVYDKQTLTWQGTQEAEDATTYYEDIDNVADALEGLHYEPGEPGEWDEAYAKSFGD